MRDSIVKWISLLVFIAISILLVKFFLFILPILIGIFIGYVIYSYFKGKFHKDEEVEFRKSRSNSRSKKKDKDKKIIIIDEER